MKYEWVNGKSMSFNGLKFKQDVVNLSNKGCGRFRWETSFIEQWFTNSRYDLWILFRNGNVLGYVVTDSVMNDDVLSVTFIDYALDERILYVGMGRETVSNVLKSVFGSARKNGIDTVTVNVFYTPKENEYWKIWKNVDMERETMDDGTCHMSTTVRV